jgi:2-polyprenyl-3-methyl-5-hydroxy-6-metoxy-1,4-benzoquinol methylase
MPSPAETATERNRAAWNAERYDSWVRAMGTPAEEAARLAADPANKLRRFISHLGEIRGRRFCNVQGSHGRVAVALALLGGEATVIDFSEENRRYALELAEAAGVEIDYRLADSMQASALGLEPFDALVLELGILHYHQDIGRFFAVMRELTAPGGRMVLHEFHPVERKLIMEGGPRDYFHSELLLGPVPNPVAGGPKLGECVLRLWTLGEIVTTALAAGWRIDALEEGPSWIDPTIPGTFTLVGTKTGD